MNVGGLAHLLSTAGIGATRSPFTQEFIREFNEVLDGILHQRNSEPRAYVTVDELANSNLIEPILEKMRGIITSILPDPVLYHCHVYEIAGNSTKSHIHGNSLHGWHKDIDCEFDGSEASHVSIFVYLTDVSRDNGPFEFCPHSFAGWPRSSSKTVTVTGRSNYCFAFNRAFLHRAAPNISPTRRRLLKISIQPNSAENQHIKNSRFDRVRAIVPTGDNYIDTLLGRNFGGQAPGISRAMVDAEPISPTGRLDVSNTAIYKKMAREKLNSLKALVGVGNNIPKVSYD